MIFTRCKLQEEDVNSVWAENLTVSVRTNKQIKKKNNKEKRKEKQPPQKQTKQYQPTNQPTTTTTNNNNKKHNKTPRAEKLGTALMAYMTENFGRTFFCSVFPIFPIDL